MNDFTSTEFVPSYTSESYAPSHPPEGLFPPTQTLQLLHVNNKQQKFSFPPETSQFQYDIKVHQNTGFLKKPDLLVSRDIGTLEEIGEGRFEKYGPGTTIKYSESGETHDLQLESSLSQRFVVTVDGKALWWWQPSRHSKLVAEVVTARNELMAGFTFSGEHTLVGRNVKDDTVLGVLEVGEQYVKRREVLDQLVSMTVVLVERGKRRGQNLRAIERTSPIASSLSSGMVY